MTLKAQRTYNVGGPRRGDGTFIKDPNSVLDYTIQWGQLATLGEYLFDQSTDQIATSAWTVPAGLTEDSSTNTSLSTTIWLSGGTAGESYEVTNRITTTGGRTFDQSIRIRCKSL